MKLDRDDIITLIVLAFGLPLIFCTTLLLDWPWIQRQIARQVLVYALLVFELFMFVRLIVRINK